jgi:hypothetical protein
MVTWAVVGRRRSLQHGGLERCGIALTIGHISVRQSLGRPRWRLTGRLRRPSRRRRLLPVDQSAGCGAAAMGAGVFTDLDRLCFDIDSRHIEGAGLARGAGGCWTGGL